MKLNEYIKEKVKTLWEDEGTNRIDMEIGLSGDEVVNKNNSSSILKISICKNDKLFEKVMK